MDLSEFSIYQPPAELSHYVRRYFCINRVLDRPITFDMFASGSAYLVNFFSGTRPDTEITINGDPVKRVTQWNIGGPILKGTVGVYEPSEMRMIACEFSATGIYSLFGISAEQLVDKRVELEVLPERFIKTAQQFFMGREEATDESLVEEMNGFIATLAQEARPIGDDVRKAIQLLEAADGIIRVSDVVKQLEVGERTFSRHFKEQVGMTPKQYQLVLQINFALRLMNSKQQMKFSAIALEAGFCDQAHFNRIMQVFFHQNPSDFINENEDELMAFQRGKNRFEAFMAAKKKDETEDD